MNNLKVIFATMIIFGAGVVTGDLMLTDVTHSNLKNGARPAATPTEGSSSSTNTPSHPAIARKLPRPPEILAKRFLQQWDERLNLTADQHASIQKIIIAGQNQMRKTLQDARLEIREILTPEQRREFDKLVNRPFRKPIFGTNAPVMVLPATNLPATAK